MKSRHLSRHSWLQRAHRTCGLRAQLEKLVLLLQNAESHSLALCALFALYIPLICCIMQYEAACDIAQKNVIWLSKHLPSRPHTLSILLCRPKQKSSDAHQLHAAYRVSCTTSKGDPECRSEPKLQLMSCSAGGGIDGGGRVQFWGYCIRGSPVAGDPRRKDWWMGRDWVGEWLETFCLLLKPSSTLCLSDLCLVLGLWRERLLWWEIWRPEIFHL